MELDKLQLLLQNAATNQAGDAGLKMRLEEAKALRDQKMPGPAGKTGYTSPLALIAHSINTAKGRSDARTAQEGLAKSRAIQNQAITGEKMYGLGRDEDMRNEDVDFRNTTQADTRQHRIDQAAAAQAKVVEAKRLTDQKRDDDLAKRDRHMANIPEEYGGGVGMIRIDQNGDVEYKGQIIPAAEAAGFTDAPKATSNENLNTIIDDSGGYGTASNQKIDKGYFKTMWRANKLIGQANKFTLADKEHLNNKWTQFKALAVEGFSPDGWESFFKENLTDMSDAAKEFYISLSRLSSEEQKTFFGSALTKTEDVKAQNFVPNVKGLSLDGLIRRIEVAARDAGESLAAGDAWWGKTRHADILKRANLSNLGTYVPLSKRFTEDVSIPRLNTPAPPPAATPGAAARPTVESHPDEATRRTAMAAWMEKYPEDAARALQELKRGN